MAVYLREPDDDFFVLFSLSSTRKIRPKRRHTATSRNPLKTMSACLEVRSEYTEIITGVADKELKRIQTAKSKFSWIIMVYKYSSGLQIRRSKRDNLGIIFNISPLKHIL